MRLPMIALSAALLVGCSGSEPKETPETATVAVPATLFVDAAPADAVPLVDAKQARQPGDRIVFEARIGGRREAFVAGRAMFFATDSSLKDCAQLHGDTCKTPWDYCCEPPDSLRRHMATVQVVDDLWLERVVRLVDGARERQRQLHAVAIVVVVDVVAPVRRRAETSQPS